MTPRRVADVDYMLVRSPVRRTADIVIERDGVVTVRAPARLADDEVDRLVEGRLYWIYKNLAEWRDLNAARIPREWRNGEGFLYLGANYRLRLVSGQDVPLALKDGRFCLRRELVEQGDAAGAQAAFRDYYVERGRERLRRRVALFAPKVGVEAPVVVVSDLGFRWASCSADGRLSFHWKCMMATPRVIDYIAVHELCHIHRRDHDEVFWNEVDKVLPDYEERKAWLRINGAALDL